MTYIAGIARPGTDAADVCLSMQSQVRPERSAWSAVSLPSLSFAVHQTARLPEDKYDRQPLAEDGLRLIGDIRIDNREELSSLFGWTSNEARCKADSDYFLAAWKLWGKNALRQIVGGFAVALWNEQTQGLTLVRDHVGERPLYFLYAQGTFAFSSLPTSLRCLPGIDTSLDEDRMLLHLAVLGGTPTQTFFKNVQSVPPGHCVTFRNGHVQIERYWHPLDAPQIRYSSDEEYVEAFRERFDLAVGARLRTIGCVGSELSGGMDSSSVSATAARLLRSRKLTCYTAVPQSGFSGVNPSGRFGDEGPAAARLAAMYANIDHVLIDSADEDLIQAMQAMGRLQGHPVFNPLNQMWLTAMMDDARERGVKVMLQGACGNATISAGGLTGLSELFLQGKWLRLIQLIDQLREHGHTGLRNALSFATGPILPQWIRKLLSPELASFNFDFCPARPELVVSRGLREKTLAEFFGHDNSVAGFRRHMFDYYDVGFANGALSLGWDIEARDPTQDKRIFEFCYAIPIEQYLVGGQTRSLVRRAMKGSLPESTLACTDRGLQAADWYLTLGARRDQMAAELAAIRLSPAAHRLLDLERMSSLLETWPKDGFELEAVSDSWHLALVRGLSAGNFIRNFE